MGREILTDRQTEVYEYVEGYIRSNGYSPSYREIADHIGVSSPNAVSTHVDALVRKGWLERTDTVARSLVVVGRKRRRR